MPVKSKQTLWLITLAVFLLFVVITLILDRTLTLTSGEHLALRIGLILLGLIAAVLVYFALRPRPPVANVTGGSDDAQLVMAAARERLPRGAFDKRSLVLIAGAENSCKTTLVTRSGSGAELLAGDAARTGNSDAPTKSANVWVVQQALVVEAGPSVLIDPTRWQKFTRYLRGPRVAAAFGRSEPPPRSVVICVSCELFYSGGAGEQLDALAAATRQRLADAAKEWGIELPVYVMFTKMDRIPHFEEWAAPFAREEAAAALGASLPFDKDRSAATYSERLNARLTAAFEELIASLATRRLVLLGRDNVFARRLGAYEFPRELRKISPVASRFLTELCRPTQLGSSPLLRGFYFMGARPVIVRDVASQPAAINAQQQQHAADATGIFMRGGASPVAAQQSGSAPLERKVPEWMFIERFFPDVVLADTGAASTARGGVRVSGLRRALLAASIAACLFIAVAFTISWVGNRGLANRTVEAARAVSTLPVVRESPGSITFPPTDALRSLDQLRALLDTLRTYQTEGAPLHLRWGLWRGKSLFADALPVWFDGFRRQLFATASKALVDSLSRLPDSPNSGGNNDQAYNWLRAYLITTANHENSTSDFLTPVLMTSWQRGQPTDSQDTELAQRQFDFYSTELARENPYPAGKNSPMVEHARGYIARLSGVESIYRAMIAAAAAQTPSVKFGTEIKNAAGVIAGQPEIPGAFTEPGWRFMQEAFGKSDKYFKGEPWVVGDSGAKLSLDPAVALPELRERYRSDYINQWRAYLRAAKVIQPSSVQDAAAKLAVMGGSDSPLLHMFALAARSTNPDSVVAKAFQPAHAVTPPDVKDKFMSPANEEYAKQLVMLQGALEGVQTIATDTASALARKQEVQKAIDQANAAKASARTLEQKFNVDTAASQISATVRMLLLAPITGAEAALQLEAAKPIPTKKVVAAAPPPPAPKPTGGGGPPPPSGPPKSMLLNQRGAAFCQSLGSMTQKFPFTSTASSEATADDIKANLGPSEGALFKFYHEALEPYLEKKGETYVSKPADGVTLSPSFVTFFNNAAKVSAALFPRGAAPLARYEARGVTAGNVKQIQLKGGGGIGTFDAGKAAFSVFTWPSAPGATLYVGFKNNKPIKVDSADGDWAMFRMVAKAKFDKAGDDLWKAEWAATGKDAQPVQIEFRFPEGPILQRDWMGNMLRCESTVAQ